MQSLNLEHRGLCGGDFNVSGISSTHDSMNKPANASAAWSPFLPENESLGPSSAHDPFHEAGNLVAMGAQPAVSSSLDLGVMSDSSRKLAVLFERGTADSESLASLAELAWSILTFPMFADGSFCANAGVDSWLEGTSALRALHTGLAVLSLSAGLARASLESGRNAWYNGAGTE
jgi:hypothetical protein